MSVDRFFPGEKIYLLDGGMGSLLQKKGLPSGQAPEYMNIHHPEKVREVHLAYIEAGSDLIETNTFGGNPITLEKNGLAGLTAEVNQRAAELALEAGKSGQVRAVGSIGPTGELLAPLGGLDQDQAEEAFTQQCQALKTAGIQVVNVETMSDLRELKAAVIAAKKCGLEVMAEVSFMANGFTLSGATPQVVAATLAGLGVMAGGINCGLGPGEIKPLIKEMADSTTLPLIVQPNAGLPQVVEGQTVYNLTAGVFADLMRELLVETRPLIVGGCCGTTPEHIKAVRRLLDDPAFSRIDGSGARQPAGTSGVFLAGRAKGFFWNGDFTPVKFVEAKPLNAEEVLVAGKIMDLFGLAQTGKESQADIIRLNLDEWQATPAELKTFVINAQLYFAGPFSVFSTDPELLEVFFHYYIGRPLWEKPSSLQEWDNFYIPGSVTV